MKPFFDSETQIARLQYEVAGWLGTPFVENCGGKAAKGVRADCTWVAAPLQRLGAIGKVEWPKRYVVRGGGPEVLTMLCGVMDRAERAARIWRRPDVPAGEEFNARKFAQPALPEPMAGDVVVMSTGIALHHLVLCLGGGVVAHSWSGKIQLASAADHRERLWYALYRPVLTPGT